MNDMRDWPTDLPLFASDVAADAIRLTGEEDPAAAARELTSLAGLGRHLDGALAGAAAPRVWLLIHEPDQTHLAAVAALAFTEALAARDQVAFILDGDDHTTTLSRWYGRGETEGWIDLVRYGASVLTAGEGLPFSGRTAYLLGVGSYAPTDATAEDVDQLLGRLRRQADDILVVAPLDTAGLWGRVADIRLLCLDRAQRRAKDVAALVNRLQEVGSAPTGFVAWGSAAADTEAAAVTDEESGAAAVEVSEVDLDAGTGTVQQQDVVTSEAGSSGEMAPRELLEPADDMTDPTPTRRSTSGVFWFVAVTAVVIIGAIGAYYLRYMREPADEPMPPPVVVVPRSEPASPVVMDTVVVATSADTLSDMDSAPADTGMQTTVAEPELEPEPEPEPTRPLLAPTSYTGTVGAEGWALHLYSFPDSASAAQEVAILARRGINAAVRTVEIPDKGRYHRVYVGSFLNRSEANAAIPALLAKLRTDWANPVHFGGADR